MDFSRITTPLISILWATSGLATSKSLFTDENRIKGVGCSNVIVDDKANVVDNMGFSASQTGFITSELDYLLPN